MMKCISSHVVTAEQAGMLLRNCAAEVFLHIPRKGIRKAIQKGQIRLDGVQVPSNSVVHADQAISLWTSGQAAPQFQYPLTFIHIDNDIAVIDKPSGLLVSGNAHRTVQRALESGLTPSRKPDALDLARPVHRLDKGTSGILVIARTVLALRQVSQQFEERTVEKEYEAIVWGKLEGEGTIDNPVDEKVAQTQYKLLSHGSFGAFQVSHVHVKPLTGRRHQIRVHLASLGHPVIGDTLYGHVKTTAPRLMLHAVRIKLKHPANGRYISFESGLPEQFNIVRNHSD